MLVEKELINDDRLTPTMKRGRSGTKQYFKEYNPDDRTSVHENAEVVLEHPTDVAMYAELIDGEWYWVTGCAECKGEPRNMMSYVECDKHNVSKVCSIKSKDLPEGVVRWGGDGWTCGTCKDARDAETRREAFEKLDGEEPDCFYTDEPICPHCGSELGSDDLYESQDIECYVCEGNITVEVEFSRSFTTKVKGKRIKK
jgi:hypothetical protein